MHETGIKCNWVENSVCYIFQCLDKAWESTVASRIQRKGFDVKAFSVRSFQKLISERGPQFQGLLTAVASGKHVTMDALVHYARDDASCPFCDAVDGKDHRIYHCNGLSDLRDKYKGTIKWLKKQPQAVLTLVWCLMTMKQSCCDNGFSIEVLNVFCR